MQVTAQAEVAVDEADVVLVMVDTTTGITPADEEIAEHLRGTNKPILCLLYTSRLTAFQR